MDTKIQLQTERLLIREYQSADWKAVHDYARIPDILIYEAWGPNSEKDTQNFVEKVLEDQQKLPRTAYDLSIILKKENKLIGGCRFGFTTADESEGDIGYIIHPGYWSAGYAAEATNALINHMAAISPVKIIRATCDVLNIASQSVLQKCGFKLTAKIEKDIFMKGRYRDTYVYEKII